MSLALALCLLLAPEAPPSSGSSSVSYSWHAPYKGPAYKRGTKLEWYDGAGIWGFHRGVIEEMNEEQVIVWWYWRSERMKIMGEQKYTRHEFNRWMSDDDWAPDIVPEEKKKIDP